MPLLQQKHQSSRFRHEGAAEDNYLEADDDGGDATGDDAGDDFI